MSRCTCLRDSKTTLLSTYDQPKKGNPHRDIRFAPTRIKFRTPKTTHQCSLTWFKKCRETDPPIRLSNGTQTEFPLFFGGFHTFLQDWLGVVLSKCVPFRPGHITTKTYPNLCKLNDFQKTTCFTYNFTSIKNTWWWIDTIFPYQFQTSDVQSPKTHRIRVLHSCYLHVLGQGVEMVIEILHIDLVAP